MASKINLKNYTSEVSAAKSIQKIENCLVEAGASDINKKYENGVIVSVSFRMMVTGNVPVFFKMPAKVDHCFNVFWKQRVKKYDSFKKGVMEQAERTAWKIMSDWVEIQLSLIQLEQAEPLQVFLPYVFNPAKDETLYEKITSNGMKLLTE